MILMKERVGKLLEYLKDMIYPDSEAIGTYRMIQTEERFTNISNLDTSDWQELGSGQLWGGHRQYYWFETTLTIPDRFDGACVVYELITGKEGAWDATNPQFTLYIDGKIKQGLDVNHRETVLTEHAEAGHCYRIVLSAFTGDQNFSLKLDSKLKVLDRKTEKYYYDLHVPYDVARMLNADDPSYITIITSLNESLNLLDMRREYSDEYYSSMQAAQKYIAEEFYEKRCSQDSSEAAVYCVGHTHIDVAWLWTLAVTEDKSVRSFSTVLDLMDQYPEYIFMSSQPQLYQYVKKNAPEVYERIKERIAEGRWEPEGGMFVEADCNIASGEALIRQFIYGQRFFKEEFDKDNVILWLPDVFGYSAAIPQIMQKCGLKYFMTTKISWNEFNKMPYDTFEWEGIDGSRVLTHFIPSRDYHKAADEGGFMTEHFTTYNGMLEPIQVKGGWNRYDPKYLNQEVLMSYGYGDGGGGPTSTMLENERRMAHGIPGCPRTVNSTARHFFEVLEEHVKDSKYLPSWIGELYLEYHRGTYTSMARNKKYNRKSEFAYQNAELYGIMDRELTGASYPEAQIHEAWEVILRNQFHDILPGSSIKEVYDDSKAEYEGILATNKELVFHALQSMAEQVNAPKNSLVVYNPNSFPADEVVEFDSPLNMVSVAVYDGGRKVTAQPLSENRYLFQADGVPAKGYKTFLLKENEENLQPYAQGNRVESPQTDVQEQGTDDLPNRMHISKHRMENDFFILDLNEQGQFSGIYDKLAKRSVMKEGQVSNVIMTYEDRPHNYDAWDVNHYYTEKSWEVDQVESIEIVEHGPVRACVRISRAYLDSTIVQSIYLYRDIPRIDIKNEIDWKEHQIFVKALYPVDVHTSEATFDIQYGNVKRATHYNTSWDFAKFEVCVHKWLDVSEDDYGVSMINDCKYGCSVHDGVIGMSMLKSAVYPNPEADKEKHEFTYSLYPHQSDWKAAGTVKQAYQLNNPLKAVVKETESGTLAAAYSFVSVDCDNVIVEVVKKAEEGNDIILRLYECYNRRTTATLTFASDIEAVYKCDMMETEAETVRHDGSIVSLTMKPYEIKTLRLAFKTNASSLS